MSIHTATLMVLEDLLLQLEPLGLILILCLPVASISVYGEAPVELTIKT